MTKIYPEQNLKINHFITTILIGLAASIAFILIQPLFGMLTLTSRHAAAYVNLGGYDETTALILSWCVHMSVSIFYALVSGLIYHFNRSLLVSVGQVVLLGWFTTLIATPANEWVVKLITSGQFTAINSLAALNTDVGPKLWLHILFFALVLIGLWFIKSMNSTKEKV